MSRRGLEPSALSIELNRPCGPGDVWMSVRLNGRGLLAANSWEVWTAHVMINGNLNGLRSRERCGVQFIELPLRIRRRNR